MPLNDVKLVKNPIM